MLLSSKYNEFGVLVDTMFLVVEIYMISSTSHSTALLHQIPIETDWSANNLDFTLHVPWMQGLVDGSMKNETIYRINYIFILKISTAFPLQFHLAYTCASVSISNTYKYYLLLHPVHMEFPKLRAISNNLMAVDFHRNFLHMNRLFAEFVRAKRIASTPPPPFPDNNFHS